MDASWKAPPRMTDPGIPALDDCSPRNPLYIAHRGAAALYPENTIEAYRAAYASGLRVLEQDVCVLADGALAVLHDHTVDRTTNGRGSPLAFDAAQWRALRIDTRAYPGFPDAVAPPLFEDVLSEFKGRVMFVPEAKAPGTGAALVEALLSADIAKHHALVQAFALADLAPAIAAGYPAMFLTRHDDAIDEARAMGVTWAGLDRRAPDAVYDAWRTAGFRLIAYTVNDRVERDRLLALRVSGFFSDDPLSLIRQV
jgi:glycerophosphoryl diester phosphodiesterase